MKKVFYITEELDKTIMLEVMGGEVGGRVWCVGRCKNDLTHRKRNFDGFYNVSTLKKITV